MARKILIIARNASTAQELATVLAPLRVEVEAHRSIRTALAALIASQTDVVVIDVERKDEMGIEAAETVRQVDIRVPMVLLIEPSGETLQEERRPDLSQDRHNRLGGIPLVKPAEPALLRETVAQALALSADVSLTPGPSARFTPGPNRPPEGSLRERPVHLLLGQLWKRRVSGVLELHGKDALFSIQFRAGRIVAASDSSRTSRAADEIVIASCGLPDGRWVFHPGTQVEASAREGAVDLHPLALAAAGVATAYPPAMIRNWLQRHGDETLLADPAWMGTLAEIGMTGFPLPSLGRDAATNLSDTELPLLFAWMGFDLVRFGPPRPGRLSANEHREIDVEWRRLNEATHYEALGVTAAATEVEIKKAYYSAAKRWHSDAFAGRNLGEAVALVEKIFLRISEAYQVLENQEKRAEYDVFLDRKAKGLPTDVESVLVAEEAFRKARALFRVQRYAEAEAQLRLAVSLNPAEAEFWAYLGACSYRLRGSTAVKEAKEAFARANALIPQSLVTEYFEAQLDIGEGELEAAERRLRKILAEKPDHTEAMRDLRSLRERKQKEADSGRSFLGKLLKRK